VGILMFDHFGECLNTYDVEQPSGL
jgi:hypothetical protein